MSEKASMAEVGGILANARGDDGKGVGPGEGDVVSELRPRAAKRARPGPKSPFWFGPLNPQGDGELCDNVTGKKLIQSSLEWQGFVFQFGQAEQVIQMD
ncbi:hypothetical protein RHMOL_Rhmol04G0330400 [Rhododendron molle]|uniref:Uncharacterized protein n=1 Tax=Rhododendron molle TaxID=49168 RepID=A0ACC0P9C7_RHOML|nr:hypothetical protein RHMOL_Rhmol04G0330400 [Rhododendron molle]